MTYKENSNSFLFDSKIPCGTDLLENILRNGFMYYPEGMQIEDYYVNREATGVVGTTTLIYNSVLTDKGQNDSNIILRDGDYIYFTVFRDHNMLAPDVHVELGEYQISTDTLTIVDAEFYQIPEYAPNSRADSQIRMCVLGDRKIMVSTNAFQGYDYAYEDVYLVDFVAQSSTLSLRIETNRVDGPDIKWGVSDVLSFVDNSGDVHVYVVGDAMHWVNPNQQYGLYLYHKNFTQTSEWTEQLVYFDLSTNLDDGHLYLPPMFIKKDYLVFNPSPCPINRATQYTGMAAFVVDLHTHVMSAPSIHYMPNLGYTEAYPYYNTVDNKYGRVYIHIPYWDDIGTNIILEFDPATISWVEKYKSPELWDYRMYLSSSRVKAYIVDGAEGSSRTLDAYSLEEISSYIPPTYFGVTYDSLCSVLDSNGPSWVYWDNATTSLVCTNLTGEVVATIPTAVPSEGTHYYIYHAGSQFIVFRYKYTSSILREQQLYFIS